MAQEVKVIEKTAFSLHCDCSSIEKSLQKELNEGWRLVSLNAFVDSDKNLKYVVALVREDNYWQTG